MLGIKIDIWPGFEPNVSGIYLSNILKQLDVNIIFNNNIHFNFKLFSLSQSLDEHFKAEICFRNFILNLKS